MPRRAHPLLSVATADEPPSSAPSVSPSTSEESLPRPASEATSSSDEEAQPTCSKRVTQTPPPSAATRRPGFGAPERLLKPAAGTKSPPPAKSPSNSCSPDGHGRLPKSPSAQSPRAKPLRRAPSGLLDRIVERGKRRNSTFPVIDGLYAEANGLLSARGSGAPSPEGPELLVSDSFLSISSSQTVDFGLFVREECSPMSPSHHGEPGTNSVTVAIRIRPLSRLEVAEGQPLALAVDGQKVLAADPAAKSPAAPTQYRFDAVLCSVPSLATPLATQGDVFDAVGQPLLRNLIDGYNACLLCYGQTGSGKTFTMMGTPDEPGLVPRYAEAVFHGLQERKAAESRSASMVQVSFIEIYNEKVHDLLAPETCSTPRTAGRHFSPKDPKARASACRSPHGNPTAATPKGLRVRQHPVKGAFVEGLTQHTVVSGEAIMELVRHGNEARATAATRMNERSSRSHAIVTIEVAQQALVSQPGEEEVFSSKTSRVHLVDLAGSERVTKSGVEGAARLQELTAINLSLSTLSRVIETLSDAGRMGAAKRPPYRESTLTWLLADSFGGNSKTTMIANVSPAANSLPETTSTLRYAARARRIVNQAIINEDPSAALISALQAETQQLRAQLQEMAERTVTVASAGHDQEVEGLRGKLCFSEQLIEELKEHEEQERQRFELQIQRMSAHREEQAETHQELQRRLERAEAQLQRARQEAQRKDTEIEHLRGETLEQTRQLEEQRTEAERHAAARERQICELAEAVHRLGEEAEEARGRTAALGRRLEEAEGRLVRAQAEAAEQAQLFQGRLASCIASERTLLSGLSAHPGNAVDPDPTSVPTGASMELLEAVQTDVTEAWRRFRLDYSESQRQTTSLEAQLTASRAEAAEQRLAQEARTAALEATVQQLQAGLRTATAQAEASQWQCAEAQDRVQAAQQQLEARLAMEWATLRELRGFAVGTSTSPRPCPTPQLLEEAELRLVAGWQRMADDAGQARDRIARQEWEHHQQVEELRRTVQEQRQALEAAVGRLHGEAVAATGREAALQGSLEEKARQVLASQQDCREAQRREWETEQRLAFRMAAEWKAIQQLGGFEVESAADSGPHPSADRLEAAEAQLVAAWRRMQADLLQCRQRLAEKDAELTPVLNPGPPPRAPEAQQRPQRWPEVARLATERNQLAMQVADLQQQLEDAAERCVVAEQQRLEWEVSAKEMAAQLQEHVLGEGRLLTAVQCASSGLLNLPSAAGPDVDRALAALDALVADRAALQRRLAAAEEELARRSTAAAEAPERSDHQQIVPESAGELVAGLREAMAELELRMVAVVGQASALSTSQAAEDVLGTCERIMGQARDVLRAVAEQRLPSPRPGVRVEAAEATGPPLELVLARLQEADHAQWAAMHSGPRTETADPAVAQRLASVPADPERAASPEPSTQGPSHLVKALVEEYTRMLQDTVENRREWRALYDGLSLTMQAVSGRPRFLLFQFGPASAQALEAALRRQEELNARAAAWLMGLYTQRDVLKQNVLAQLRVNERFAQERASLVTERKALHGELADVRGKLQRAIAVVRRLHAEHDALLTTPRGGAPALPEGPPAAALPAAATRDP